MNAKLVYPDGQVQELTDSEFEQIQEVLDRDARNRRLRAFIERLENEPDDKSPEWWDEFEADLKKNRFKIPERDLGLDHD